MFETVMLYAVADQHPLHLLEVPKSNGDADTRRHDGRAAFKPNDLFRIGSGSKLPYRDPTKKRNTGEGGAVPHRNGTAVLKP